MAGPGHSARRIAQIRNIIGASCYLEVGVNAGHTFLNVEIEYKDAVDPKFRFDRADNANERVRFFEQTSDSFWASGKARVYDIIFLDGFHSFEQTARDLLCSFRHAHPRTVWLIDDTVPSDPLSALRDQRTSIKERQRLGLSGNPWHGDVYKLVPFIHDFLPVLDYRTILGSGNPQTLAWYGPRSDYKPSFNDFERISRLDYFDIERNAQLFRHASEPEALAALRMGLAG